MAKTQLIGDFLYGYIRGEERVCITNTAEQIAAFIMKNRFKGEVKIVNYMDVTEVQTMGEFVEFCSSTSFLYDELLPVLTPMQKGTIEIPEFVPYTDEAYLLKNVRLVNGNGKYVLVNVEFFDGLEEELVNDEEFDTEEELIAKYPDSMSEALAQHMFNATPYERNEFIEEFVEECEAEQAQALLGISNEELEELWISEDEKSESEAFVEAVAKKINSMSYDELLAFTFKHDMYIRTRN